jgi:hypothetical protein
MVAIQTKKSTRANPFRPAPEQPLRVHQDKCHLWLCFKSNLLVAAVLVLMTFAPAGGKIYGHDCARRQAVVSKARNGRRK